MSSVNAPGSSSARSPNTSSVDTWWKRADAVAASSFEQRLGAEHVGADESLGVEHREAVVRLRREVDDHVDLVPRQQRRHQVEVADVSLDELDPVVDLGEALAGCRRR